MISGSAFLRIAALALTVIATSCTAVVVDDPRPLPPRPGPGPGPQICTREYAPVCGERRGQNRTFGNACEARAAGYRVDYSGQCRSRPGGPGWNRPDRPGRPGPDRPGRPGWDRPDRPGAGRPGICTREYAPVCGRRGGQTRTFGNSCEAESAGFAIVGRGRC